MNKFQDILTRQGVTFHFIYHYEFICNISYDYILNLHKICKKMMYNMTIFEEKKNFWKFLAELASLQFFGVQFLENWRNSKKNLEMSRGMNWNRKKM